LQTFPQERSTPLDNLRHSFSIKNLVLLATLLGSLAPRSHAQSAPAAFRPAHNIQAGATFDLASPDYGLNTLKGFGFYSTWDFRRHLGVEAEFRQLNDPGVKRPIYERNFEIGPRYSMRFGPFVPYAKFMVGRGVFSFPPSAQNPGAGPVANLAYNMGAVGFGADYRIRPSISLRADYEFQRWIGFPPHGLTPRVASVGVAYHFR
jgi:hypothetical protein